MSVGTFSKKKLNIVFISLLLASVLLVAGCSGIGLFGDKRGQCSEGKSCTYYSGTRGIITYLESPPYTAYYNSKDLTSSDGNIVEFNVRLKNDGASPAYGAVFLTGFGPESFEIYKYVDGVPERIFIDNANLGCYFNFLGWGSDGVSFTAGCDAGSVWVLNDLNYGGSINLERVGEIFGWDLPDIDVDIRRVGDTWNFGANALGYLVSGQIGQGTLLMALISNLEFDKYGGSVFHMKGDNPDSPGGDIDYHTFQVRMVGDWPAGQDYYDIPYQIRTCYAYSTFVSPMLCIDPNPFSEEQKVCRSETYTWGGSQGAPVAVTRMTQLNTGQEVVMDITIKNVGPGTVWDVGRLEGCSPYFPGRVTSSMKNVVYIGNAWVGNRPVDCSRNYMIRLDPNTKEASFTCTYDIREAGDVGSAYAAPLKMELWYGYEEDINQQLRIRRLG